MQVAQLYINGPLSLSGVLKVVGLPRSSFYFKPKTAPKNKAGRKPSTVTFLTNGSFVSNKTVVLEIEKVLGVEFVDYGYLKVTHHLRDGLGYVINPKKVYNLMKTNGLLNLKTSPVNRGARNWAKEFVPNPGLDFAHLEFDIKYFYVWGQKRNAMVLTVIDIKSRWNLGQYIAWQIVHENVIQLFDKIFESTKIPASIFVRCDNGSQFIAQAVQDYFRSLKDKTGREVIQEFTKPATPEQNAHVESYHSIVEKVVCQRYEFENINELKNTMERFKYFYNFRRIHSGLQYKTPYKYLLNKGIDMAVTLQMKGYCPQSGINKNLEILSNN
jgi:transposase InsO family protein